MNVDFIGIGAQKSGTSWVYACLYEHPQICAPIKELHFFSRPRFEKGKEWYESHFSKCVPGTKVGEFSTSYLYSEEAPERIKMFYPDIKLIAILRNPLKRAYSQYRNAIKAGEIAKDVPFETYVEQEPTAFAQGLYAGQLERYYRHFKKEQLLVLIYEDSKKDPAAFIRRIYEFLGVDPDFMPSMLHSEINIARTPKLVIVDRIMHHIAEGMRRIGLDRLVFMVKKSGVTDAVRTVNTSEKSDTTPVDLAQHAGHFHQDAEKLRTLIGRDMAQEWSLR